MSIKVLVEQDRVHRKSTQRRNDSGELDVFEATRYFSNEVATGYSSALFSNKAMREDRQALGGRRLSLDMPPASSLPLQTHQQVEKQTTNQKHHKQPSSPGGRLASFLNSLFHQTPSKKKKSKPSSTQSMREDESVHGARRKRRSSISLFHTKDTKSVYASSTASGFRTPPAYLVSLPCEKTKSQNAVLDEKRKMDIAWLDEKFKYIEGFSEKDKNKVNNKFSFEKKRGGEVDYGGESDSSSDLFELENYDLGVYSSDLPVYGTTHMESLKRGAPISNGIL